MDAATAGLIGALSGSALSGTLAILNETMRAKRERKARWDDVRRDAYAKLIDALDHAAPPALRMPFWTQGAGSDLAERDRRVVEDYFAVARATYAVIELLASRPVRQAAEQALNTINHVSSAILSKLPSDAVVGEREAAFNSLRNARNNFWAAARKELGLKRGSDGW